MDPQLIKLAQRVFSNEEVVGNILSFLPYSLMAALDLRLVNSTFNYECLRKMRMDHRKIFLRIEEIEFFANEEDPVRRLSKVVLNQNSWLCPPLLMELYFKFLEEVVDVRILDLQLIPRRIKTDEWHFLHDQLHNILKKNKEAVTCLTGLPEFCENATCPDCQYYADRCREYGPTSFNTLVSLNESDGTKHFDRLAMSERVLREIANKCVDVPKEEIPACLSTMISEKISCHLLHIRWPEIKEVVRNIPREVLEYMIKVWRVDEVEIDIHENTQFVDDVADAWMGINYFDPFLLSTKRVMANPKLDIHVKRLYLNMENTWFLTAPRDGRLSARSYRQYILNFRRLVPTNWINIMVPRYVYPFTHELFLGLMRIFLEAAHRGFQRDLRVDFAWFLGMPEREDAVLTAEHLYQVPIRCDQIKRSFETDEPDWKMTTSAEWGTSETCPFSHTRTSFPSPNFHLDAVHGVTAEMHLPHLNFRARFNYIYETALWRMHFDHVRQQALLGRQQDQHGIEQND